MKKLLHVIASPRGDRSRTLIVASVFLRQFREIHPDWLIDELNLFQEPLPPLTARQVDGKYVLLSGHDLYGELREAWEDIEQQIERFKSAESYLISTPMWNFGIPYILKQYIDILIQPRYLFHYVKGRPEGFLKGRRMVVISSRGGDYTAPADLACDHVEPHLRTVFGFVGITDIEFIKVEPLDGISEKAVKQTIAVASQKAREAARQTLR